MGTRAKRKTKSPSPTGKLKISKLNNNNVNKSTTNKKFDPEIPSLSPQGHSAAATSNTGLHCTSSHAASDSPTMLLQSIKKEKVKPIFADASAKLVISELEKLELDEIPIIITNRHDASKQSILCKTRADKTRVLEALNKLNIPMNSFTERGDKPLIFKLSGVPADDQTEVMELLKKANLSPSRVTFLMRPRPTNGRPTPTPIFLVSFEKGSIDLKTLRFSHARAGMQSLTWEIFHSANRRPTQCHRCQGWGHAESNCLRPPKCFKCAEGHHTKDCTVADMTTSAKKCANCKGEHLANSRECPVRIKFEKAKENRITKKRPQREPQEQPRTFKTQIGNAWENRQSAPVNNNVEFPPLSQHENGPPPVSNTDDQICSRQQLNSRASQSAENNNNTIKMFPFQAPSKPVSFTFGNSSLSRVPIDPLPHSLNPPLDELRSLVRELREGLNLLNQVKEFFPVLLALRQDAPRFFKFCSQERCSNTPGNLISPSVPWTEMGDDMEADSLASTLSPPKNSNDNV